MLGLQGNASSPKVYRCVACSATFNGLASLLVHQATHANVASKDPDLPSTEVNHSLYNAPSESTGSSSEHPGSEKASPDSPSSFYICDCGEEFQDFPLMLEHKRSHAPQLQQPLHNNTTPQLSFSPASQSDVVLSCPSTSMSPAAELPILPALKADVSQTDGIAIVTSPQGQCALFQEEEGFEDMSATVEKMPEIDEDMHFQVNTNSVDGAEMTECTPRNDALMDILVSTYSPCQSPNQNEDLVIPKHEVLPVDITPVPKTAQAPIHDLSVAQLRRLLAKPGIKTKSPSISKILDSSRKKVVSLTKTFSPVVLLETRNTLMDPSNHKTYGRYQCGRCRRVFQNLNRLTEHHFLHKKERIKCCRRCKQLIIGRMPLPDNHVCPQFANRSKQSSGSLKVKLPFPQKIVPFHGLSSTKKVFFCPLCKHSYARRWNLKTHKCQGPQSSLVQSRFSVHNMLSLKNPNMHNSDKVQSEFMKIKTVGVGTEPAAVKLESTSPEQLLVSHVAWTHPAKQFSPFSAKSSIAEPHVDSSLPGISPQQGENNWDSQEVKGSQGQWLMPLDEEMEMLSSAGKAGENSKAERPMVVQHTEMTGHGLRYFVKDGVRRYPCSRCQKTYSRASTLRRHLRLCGFKPRGFGAGSQSGGQGAITLNAGLAKPMFACFVCGKTFNRKDNMMVHRRRCQLQRTVANVEVGPVRQSVPSNTTDSPAQEDDGGNWGIMSLPSVLPRRVTCECGVGFTSPRLLLEHLQKHAQESYTCPTCGETVKSWADYEVHLQIHMHSHNQLLTGLQPQRSQPLLLRFQQQQQPQPLQQQPQPLQQQQQQHQSPRPPQSAHPQPQKHRPAQLLNPAKKQQRIVCSRCNNTFATRCSLRRHLSWNRCKGVRITNQFANPPKAYHCSNCNSDFPNAVSLMFHQRSGACKPTIKPVRCPVCLRWFGAVDSLQKHLLTHKQSDAYRCDVCNGTYPNLKSLKNHRRRIHRILIGNTKPNTQEQQAS
ncbi:zinc finger protein 865 [Salarias fasciatus]|uniref:zinc finger protein 865 n=1 Tax=Salarias fasciatus TaxID=181472 RepID=UPI0011766612|nr:zinc finger protein 865-like [Salarias fasciatus]XP_029959298.1 zinc finger protein 865-like [Salarias fasciatus]